MDQNTTSLSPWSTEKGVFFPVLSQWNNLVALSALTVLCYIWRVTHDFSGTDLQCLIKYYQYLHHTYSMPMSLKN